MPSRSVVVTGIGAITAIGSGSQGLWEGVLRARSGIRRITRFDPAPFRSQLAAEIDNFGDLEPAFGRSAKRLDRFSRFAVFCARQALRDADLSTEQLRTEDVAVYIGSALGGVAFGELQHQRYLNGGIKAVAPAVALSVFVGAGPSNVAIDLGLRGPAISNANSCASGAVALGEALHLVRNGRVDVALAGGVEAPLAPLTFGSFALIRAMSAHNDSPSRACRPFDRDRDGFVMGEGGAILVLEELQHALARGAHIYADLAGYASTTDAHHMTIPLPDGEQAARAIQLALSDAGATASEVGYVNAHATGTVLGDTAEAAALRIVFGRYTPPVSGTKPLYGHPLGASPAIEAAITALALEHHYAPATSNLCDVADDCQITHVIPPGQRLESGVAVTTAFGFGGVNAALILRSDHHG